MDAAGIDLLIVSDPSNMNWLTGYDGWSFYVHQAVVLPLDDDPLWFGRGQDGNGARLTSWLPEERIHAYPDHYVQSTELPPDGGPWPPWSGIMAGVRAASAWRWTTTISPPPPIPLFSARVAQRPLSDATRWSTGSARSSRTRAGLHAQGRPHRGCHARAHPRVVEPGMRKSDLVAEIYDAALRGTTDFGGDYAAIVPLVPSGVEASART